MAMVVVAGATGNLGGRIVRALRNRGADVTALVRSGTVADKTQKLEALGAVVIDVDYGDVDGLRAALAGADCVVSALNGLGDIVVDAQTALLEAALAADVSRFIPSDYAADFTKLDEGENRNFDLRRQFRQRLLAAPIGSTSILIGMFMDLLAYGVPLLNLKQKQVAYWENADQPQDFTTMDDTAAFTAAAALDPSAPLILRAAGDVLSARQIAELAGEVLGGTFELIRAGSLDDLKVNIAHMRGADPDGETEEFPVWQRMQYTHNMASGRAKLHPLDNDRYPEIRWTRLRDLLAGLRR